MNSRVVGSSAPRGGVAGLLVVFFALGSLGFTSGCSIVKSPDSSSGKGGSTENIPAMTLSPESSDLEVLGTLGFTAEGGVPPYHFSVSGGGAIDSSSGQYTAAPVPGTAMVRVTDSQGTSLDAPIRIYATLAMNPPSSTVAVNESISFSASGGISPYSFSLISGGASIDVLSGSYLSGSTPGTAQVRVTDSLGHSADALVSILPALQISPGATTLAISNTQTFSASGGMGPYAFSLVSGGGSVQSASGLYTAPASAGSATLRVTDSQGRTADASISISAGLQISPSSASLAVNNALTFGASGGVGPYSYSILSGGGSINASSGAYTAPASSGSTVIQVTDSLGNTSQSTVTIAAALAISPASFTLAVNTFKTFSATGGVPPYAYNVVSGGGSMNASTGTYTAPASPGSAVIRVSDARGNTSDASVTINPPVQISPASLTLAVNQSATFSASGGIPPYSYGLVSGSGSIHNTSGNYTAPGGAGTATARVTDSQGNAADANIIIVAAVQISPSSLFLAVNNTATFTVIGGAGPFSFSKISGGGSIQSSSGVYTAPASSGSAVVRVTDSLGGMSNANITINGALALNPPSLSLAENKTQTFSASGGVSPYTYSVVSGGGSFHTTSGLFTPPSAPATVIVRASDSYGNTKDASVAVVSALQISPTPTQAVTGGGLTFSATGGSGTYTFSMVSGAGSIESDTGDYTSGPTAGTEVVRVNDDIGNSADATIAVYEPLALSPNSEVVAPNNAISFSATGGYGTLAYSIVSGSGSVDGASGLYTAGTGAGTDVVRVSDSLGNSEDATVTINGSLVINPASKTLTSYRNFIFTGVGGVPPYEFSLLSGSGSIQSLSGLYTAPQGPGSAMVRVTDDLGNVSDAVVTLIKPVKVAAGGFHNCALFSNGQMKCWGNNAYGQLGYGNTNSRGDAANEMADALPFVNLGSGRTVQDMALGYHHSCALLDDGSVKCWGRNNYGQLGQGSTASLGDAISELGDNLPTVDLGYGRTAQKVFAGIYNTCALLDDGTLKCWGYNTYGNLGLGHASHMGDGPNEMGDDLPAVNLGTGRTAVDVSVGYQHTCAILDNGSLKCWGRSNYGQIGLGTTATLGDASSEMGNGLAAVNLGTGRTAKSVAAGYYHTCVILDNDQLKCFGRNNRGQLGIGNTTTIGTSSAQMGNSLAVTNLGSGIVPTSIQSLAYFNCSRSGAGGTQVRCWGEGTYGQLGIGNVNHIGDGGGEMGDSLATTAIGTGLSASLLAVGYNHVCVLTTNSRIKCWGRANNGQLGNASTTQNLGDGAGEMGDSLAEIILSGF